MSTCTVRQPYGIAEFVALVVSLLRPWLDAIRDEIAKPKPAPVPPKPQPQPEPVTEPVTEPVAEPVPVVVEVTPAVEPAGEPLFVKKGDGRGSRYVQAGPDDDGPKFRRRMIGTSRVNYEPAA